MKTDVKQEVSKACPRCLGPMPNHPGALSRADNQTEVCSQCGVEEALSQWAGQLAPVAAWPITPNQN